jgi:hypothetical protein
MEAAAPACDPIAFKACSRNRRRMQAASLTHLGRKEVLKFPAVSDSGE